MTDHVTTAAADAANRTSTHDDVTMTSSSATCDLVKPEIVDNGDRPDVASGGAQQSGDGGATVWTRVLDSGLTAALAGEAVSESNAVATTECSRSRQAAVANDDGTVATLDVAGVGSDHGLCRVCGDDATGMYFGALVCVPCKVSNSRPALPTNFRCSLLPNVP